MTTALAADTVAQTSTGSCAALQKLLRSDRGSVAVELVIVIPIMVLLMVGFS
jgi:Flp pilus assembly protein TadG